MDSGEKNYYHRINRNLKQPTDIYLAKYDEVVGNSITKVRQQCPGSTTFLPLPYRNVSRYAKISKSLNHIKNAKAVTFMDIKNGIQSYSDMEIDFTALRKYCDELGKTEKVAINKLFKFMASLALELNKETFEKIPLLTINSDISLSLSQKQVAILLANGFFCTFEDSVKQQGGTYTYSTFNFVELFSLQTFKSVEKLKCLFVYFSSVHEKMPNGMITILRQKCSTIPIENVELPLATIRAELLGLIEDQFKEAQVNFAQNYIGGNALSNGTSQGDIGFLIAPEALISCLVCEQLQKNETILILGAQRFANYRGFKNTLKFEDRKQIDKVGRTSLGHFPSCIIAIDAVHYNQPEKQFLRVAIDREIQKALVGFSPKLPLESLSIATGNWGVGAYKGNIELKFLIQLIAASVTGRELHYFTCGNQEFYDKIAVLMETLKDNCVSVGRLYSKLIEGGAKPSSDLIAGPFDYILSEFGKTAAETEMIE